MKPVPVDPGDGIDVDAEGIVHDREGFHEPLFVVERAMGDSHMNDGRQIQPRDEPARDEIRGAEQEAGPGAETGRGEVGAGRRIGKKDRIADCVVNFHEISPRARLVFAFVRAVRT